MQQKKNGMDPEAVLATLNQMSQTIQTLTGTIARLEKYVQAHLAQEQKTAQSTPASAVADNKKILH